MNRVIELGAQDVGTLGRRTPPLRARNRHNSLTRHTQVLCGNSNVGLFPHDLEYGDVKIEKVFFGISQSVSSPASYVSASPSTARSIWRRVLRADLGGDEAPFTDDLVAMRRGRRRGERPCMQLGAVHTGPSS